MKEESKKESLFHKKGITPFLIYTLIFTGLALFVVYIFKKYNKGFIWEVDAIKQHIITLQHFRNLIIEFIKSGSISTFTWNIGNGMDLFGNLSYYVVGDLFSYFSILFPTSKMELCYTILIFVRWYCIGIAFLCYCHYKKINNIGSIVGTLMYTFCSFVLLVVVRHPFFVNSMILFPLVMIGIEKIILQDKKTFYTIMIALTFIVNFYFAYMISLIIAIYGIILAVNTYKNDGIKKIIQKLLQVLFYSLLGVMISAIILLPTGIQFLQSERSGTSEIQPYALSYYRNLVKSLLELENTTGYHVLVGVQSIILITLPVFIRNWKKNKSIFLLMLILIVPLLSANVGSAFCGFSFPNNRWSFTLVFIFSFITALFFNRDVELDKKDFIAISILVFIYFFTTCIFDISMSTFIKSQIALFILYLLLNICKSKLQLKLGKVTLYHLLIVVLIIIGICLCLYNSFDIPKGSSKTALPFFDEGSYDKIIDTSNYTIKDFKKASSYIKKQDGGFFNISKYPNSFDQGYENVPLIRKYRAMGSYYSITPHNYQDISMDLQNSQYGTVSYGLMEFDYRTKISTLLGVKYYIKSGNNVVPYGYTRLEDYKGKSEIYVNNYSLPFGVLYNHYITEAEYESMIPLEKENSLLKNVMLQEDNVKNAKIEHAGSLQNNIQKLDYKVIDKDNLMQGNQIKITNINKNKIQLEIGNVKNSEIYLYCERVKYKSYTKEEAIKQRLGKNYTKMQEKNVRNEYKWYQPTYNYNLRVAFDGVSHKRMVRDYKTATYYFDNDQMLFNLGYYDEISGIITLSFSRTGTFDLSDIQILAVSMDGYEEEINELKKSNFEVTSYGNGYMNAKANPETDGILQFSTMYNKGWKVYVDGVQVETFEANKYFLGINITKGEHSIYMKYTTPYLKEGAIISIIGVIIFIGCIIFNKKKRMKQESVQGKV